MNEEDLKVKTLYRTGIVVLVLLAAGAVGAAMASDLRESLLPGAIAGVRINLNPVGAQLGFEIELPGDDPRLESLVRVIREAQPGGGHKCPNAGTIHFMMKDGSRVGVGLLPSHSPGLYGLRLYDGERFLKTYVVDRSELLSAVEALGVPVDDPAFRE